AIENTKGRLRTIEILSNFLRSVIVLSPDDLIFCVYLCLNSLALAFAGPFLGVEVLPRKQTPVQVVVHQRIKILGIELGIGETIMKAIAQASGRVVHTTNVEAQSTCDLGIVAEQSRSSQIMMFQPAKLNVKKVFDTLKEICLTSGNAVTPAG
ncbi:unnamed protein product, partial [Meganyctiphanes norvegica]